MSAYSLIEKVQAWGKPRVLVLGDLILDRYVWGNAERISQEAPVILLREEKQEIRLGGAANVANMVAGLEAEITLAGVIGNDRDGDELKSVLKKRGINTEAIINDANRPTTVKERMLGHAQHRHPHQMLRIDRESREPLDFLMTMKLLDRLVHLLPQHDAVLISDYAKGVCTEEILQRVIKICRSSGIPCIVDPALNANYNWYRGASAATPNRLETSKAWGREIKSIDNACQAGVELAQKYDFEAMMVTIDRDGIVVVHADGTSEHHPTRIRDVCDITGAGDMVLASIGVGAAAGLSFDDMARLANIAGGLEVEQVGCVCISRLDMINDLLKAGRSDIDKFCDLDLVAVHAQARKKTGQKVVLTNGCFDVMHIGHVSYLKQARALGDCLIVAINSDDSVRQLGKAPDRPIFPEAQRAEMLASLECVDYVTVFNELTPHQVLWKVKPDILVKGGTYTPEQIVGREIVESYGGMVKALGETPGVSTTEILRKLRGEPTTIPLEQPSRKAA